MWRLQEEDDDDDDEKEERKERGEKDMIGREREGLKLGLIFLNVRERERSCDLWERNGNGWRQMCQIMTSKCTLNILRTTAIASLMRWFCAWQLVEAVSPSHPAVMSLDPRPHPQRPLPTSFPLLQRSIDDDDDDDARNSGLLFFFSPSAAF